MRLAPLFIGCLLSAGHLDAADPPKSKLPFPINKETTFITGPLASDGYLDYEAALNEMMRGKSTPETNAIIPLWQACGAKHLFRPKADEYWKLVGMTPPGADGEYFVELEKFLAKKRGRRATDKEYAKDSEIEVAIRKQPWTRENHPLIAAWLDEMEKPLEQIHAATKRPHYFDPCYARTKEGKLSLVINSLATHDLTDQYRKIFVLLCARAMYRVANRECEAAWEDLLACHKLSRLIGRGNRITYLVAIAGDSIAFQTTQAFLEHANLNAKQAQRCLNDLQKLEPLPSLHEVIHPIDRIESLDMLQSALSRRAESERKLSDESIQALREMGWATIFQTCNKKYDATVSVLRIPDPRRRRVALDEIIRQGDNGVFPPSPNFLDLFTAEDADIKAWKQLPPKQFSETLLASTLRSLGVSQYAHDRVSHQMQIMQIAFALAAYRADEEKYPAKLADLTPKYLREIPDDLYSGKPLIYQPTAKGYLLYSVGENGQDDGGATYGDTPKGDDLPVRIPREKS